MAELGTWHAIWVISRRDKKRINFVGVIRHQQLLASCLIRPGKHDCLTDLAFVKTTSLSNLYRPYVKSFSWLALDHFKFAKSNQTMHVCLALTEPLEGNLSSHSFEIRFKLPIQPEEFNFSLRFFSHQCYIFIPNLIFNYEAQSTSTSIVVVRRESQRGWFFFS